MERWRLAGWAAGILPAVSPNGDPTHPDPTRGTGLTDRVVS